MGTYSMYTKDREQKKNPVNPDIVDISAPSPVALFQPLRNDEEVGELLVICPLADLLHRVRLCSEHTRKERKRERR